MINYPIKESKYLKAFLFIIIFIANQNTAYCVIKDKPLEVMINIELEENKPIPRDHYKTWSFLVINNPKWLIGESDEKLFNLYLKFLAFGNAIGPEHAAIIFMKSSGKLDIERQCAFAAKLNLEPSKGPYIIITSTYPGKALRKALLYEKYGNRFPEQIELGSQNSIITLNNMNSSEIIDLLTKLADQILLDDLKNFDPKSEAYWRTWQKCYETVREELFGLSNRIKFTINTNFFKIEIGH